MIGVFKIKTGTVLEFKKLLTSDGSLMSSEDPTQSFIDFNVNFDDTSTATNRAWSANRISTRLADKADKVSGATSGNFAGLNGAGNLADSGFDSSSFLLSTTDAEEIPFDPTATIVATNVQAAIEEVDGKVITTDSDLTAHINDLSNPHEVTKAQVGLGNVTDDQQMSLKDFQTAETQQANNTTTLATALSFSFAPATSGDYMIEWYFELAKDAPSAQTVIAQVSAGTTLLAEVQPRYNQNNAFTSFSGFQQLNLTAASQTYTVEFAKVGGAPAGRDALIRSIRMRIIKV